MQFLNLQRLVTSNRPGTWVAQIQLLRHHISEFSLLPVKFGEGLLSFDWCSFYQCVFNFLRFAFFPSSPATLSPSCQLLLGHYSAAPKSQWAQPSAVSVDWPLAWGPSDSRTTYLGLAPGSWLLTPGSCLRGIRRITLRGWHFSYFKGQT